MCTYRLSMMAWLLWPFWVPKINLYEGKGMSSSPMRNYGVYSHKSLLLGGCNFLCKTFGAWEALNLFMHLNGSTFLVLKLMFYSLFLVHPWFCIQLRLSCYKTIFYRKHFNYYMNQTIYENFTDNIVDLIHIFLDYYTKSFNDFRVNILNLVHLYLV